MMKEVALTLHQAQKALTKLDNELLQRTLSLKIDEMIKEMMRAQMLENESRRFRLS